MRIAGLVPYIEAMNDLSPKTILENVEAWPGRQELADYARVIEARRNGIYRIDESERLALEEGLDDADKGRFASKPLLAESAKRFKHEGPLYQQGIQRPRSRNPAYPAHSSGTD